MLAVPTTGKEGAEPGTGKKANQQPRLRRPIICICNDLYAPALRPLRAAAKVLHFRAPAKERLVLRLQYICAREGVKADKQVRWGFGVRGKGRGESREKDKGGRDF